MFLLFLILFVTADISANGEASFSRVLEEWMAVESAYSAYSGELGQAPASRSRALLSALGTFNAAVGELMETRVFEFYELARLTPDESLGGIVLLAEGFAAAVRENKWDEAAIAADRIRDAMVEWQRFDSGVSNRIHMNYFYQFILLGIIVVLLSLALLYLYMSLRKAQAKERRALHFSRETIMAQESERSRISMELHDAVLSEFGHLRKLTGDTGPDARRDAVLEKQREIMGRIRSICMDLMPPDFTRLDFGDTLVNLCAAFKERSGMECRISIEENMTFDFLSPEMQLQCYRLIQEAFANIEKHANAREAILVIRTAQKEERSHDSPPEKSLLICLSDDGTGFTPPADKESPKDNGRPGRKSGGLGIRSMYERAAMLGGRLDFISEAGEGTMVRFEIPFSNNV